MQKKKKIINVKRYLCLFSAFLLLSNFVSLTAYAKNQSLAKKYISKAELERLHNDPYWKILLRYRNNRSLVTDDKFFITKNGRTDYKNELHKTILSFFTNSAKDPELNPICKFPARYKWIKKKLNISDSHIKKPKCPLLEEYLEKVSANEVSIVFAAENLNNIVSMMGHIFLKISGNHKNNKVEHSLGYFAHSGSMNSLEFVAKALVGESSGVYILEPYFRKANEYSNSQKKKSLGI